MVTEALEAMAVKPSGIYVDATYGRGGHSRALLARLASGGRLLAFDRDPEAVAAGRAELGGDERFTLYRGAFSMLEQVVRQANLAGRIDGLLLDLGVSSPQLANPARGFGFLNAGPLDMRMDPDTGPSAAEWLARAGEREISDVLKRYGEERFHRRIARAIVAAGARAPIASTDRLADIVAGAVPTRERHKHPATRTFQALRILINRELDELAACLKQSLMVLARGGRVVVISFHSLEDRLVKRFMRDHARAQVAPTGAIERPQLFKRPAKPVRPGAAEISANPRARSAILRMAERL
jgi:16S rRNA (cytosine1402-N4)-methyltransferase